MWETRSCKACLLSPDIRKYPANPIKPMNRNKISKTMFSMIPKGSTMRKKLHFRRYRVRRFPILAFWPSSLRIFYLLNIFPGVAAATTSVNKYNKPAPHRVRMTIIKASAEVSTNWNLTMPSALSGLRLRPPSPGEAWGALPPIPRFFRDSRGADIPLR